MKIGEYEVVQAKNNHISVYKDGKLVSHINCTRELTETELKGLITDLKVIKNGI